jgi:RNA polymerase sigma-70 factor (ECF subfamily)
MDADATLVRECRQGVPGAFEALLDRYERPIFNVALRMVNDVEDARDITQSVFLKVIQNLDSYDSQYRFYSWIYRIAVNESLNFIKRRKQDEPISDENPAPGPNPEEAACEADLGQRVQEALMSLKSEHRAVIILKHFRGFSYREIGEILDLPEKTVKSRLFSARQFLRQALCASGAFEPTSGKWQKNTQN